MSDHRPYAFTPDAATDLGALPVVSSRAVPDGQALLADGVVYLPEHDAVATEVISAELTACVLGQRERPELRVDPAGRILHMLRRGVLHMAATYHRLMDELRSYRYPTA